MSEPNKPYDELYKSNYFATHSNPRGRFQCWKDQLFNKVIKNKNSNQINKKCYKKISLTYNWS